MRIRRPYDSEGRAHGRIIQTHKSRAIPGQEIAIQIRLDEKGRFHAKYLEEWHTADRLPDLEAALDKAVKAGGPTTWSYFIHVVAEDDSNNFHRGGFGRGRASLTLHYRVIRLSNPITGKLASRYDADEEKTYRLVGDVRVQEDGSLVDDKDRPARFQERDAGQLVPFTLERWKALEAIAEAVLETGRRLAQVLASGPGSAFLDAVSDEEQVMLSLPALPMLAAPEAPKRGRAR